MLGGKTSMGCAMSASVPFAASFARPRQARSRRLSNPTKTWSTWLEGQRIAHQCAGNHGARRWAYLAWKL